MVMIQEKNGGANLHLSTTKPSTEATVVASQPKVEQVLRNCCARKARELGSAESKKKH